MVGIIGIAGGDLAIAGLMAYVCCQQAWASTNSSRLVGRVCGPIGVGVHVHCEVVGRAAAISDILGKDIAQYPSNQSPRKIRLLRSQD